MKLVDKLAEDFNNGLHEKQHIIVTNQAAYKAGFLEALEMAYDWMNSDENSDYDFRRLAYKEVAANGQGSLE